MEWTVIPFGDARSDSYIYLDIGTGEPVIRRESGIAKHQPGADDQDLAGAVSSPLRWGGVPSTDGNAGAA